jgi:hypothetical protein
MDHENFRCKMRSKGMRVMKAPQARSHFYQWRRELSNPPVTALPEEQDVQSDAQQRGFYFA